MANKLQIRFHYQEFQVFKFKCKRFYIQFLKVLDLKPVPTALVKLNTKSAYTEALLKNP